MSETQTSRRGVRRGSPYQQWQQGEGIPVYRGAYIENLYTLALAPWSRMGQNGAFVNLAEQEADDAYVVEIAPGGQTAVQHHFFEATVYILSGRGATTLWQEGGKKQTLEWQQGSIFSPPLNCSYQHFNLDGEQPARLFAVTGAPTMMNLVRNPHFIFHCPYAFTDRYGGQDDYFTSPGHRDETRAREWVTNFIPDIRAFHLDENDPRGLGSFRMGFTLGGNQMVGHSSGWPPGTYLYGHRHGPGAHVVILEGQGYSLLWFEGEPRQQVYWQDGSVLSPQDWQYHQHFNTGPGPVRYVAFRMGDLDPRKPGAPDQIGPDQEGPAIYAQYVAECAKNGVQVTMPPPNQRRP
jgi:quercetin dioxygenase-like cupin family protein